ncbi:hypothetical protein OL548_20215 [Lysinibacillus sp. MHQ-1]|nr:hypothetical protein OL548_20215 [Lysinibacillus sp. MHQ-1]
MGITMWVFLVLSTVGAYVWCAKKRTRFTFSKAK